MQAWLKSYFSTFSKKSVTTEEMRAHFLDHFAKHGVKDETLKSIDWNTWLVRTQTHRQMERHTNTDAQTDVETHNRHTDRRRDTQTLRRFYTQRLHSCPLPRSDPARPPGVQPQRRSRQVPRRGVRSARQEVEGGGRRLRLRPGPRSVQGQADDVLPRPAHPPRYACACVEWMQYNRTRTRIHTHSHNTHTNTHKHTQTNTRTHAHAQSASA